MNNLQVSTDRLAQIPPCYGFKGDTFYFKNEHQANNFECHLDAKLAGFMPVRVSNRRIVARRRDSTEFYEINDPRGRNKSIEEGWKLEDAFAFDIEIGLEVEQTVASPVYKNPLLTFCSSGFIVFMNL